MTLQGSDLLGVPPTHLPVDPAADAGVQTASAEDAGTALAEVSGGYPTMFWLLTGLVRVATGRPFRNRPPAESEDEAVRPLASDVAFDVGQRRLELHDRVGHQDRRRHGVRTRMSAGARLAIVRAAEELFASEGIEGPSLREIARRAGQGNTNAAQYHFGDRDGLLLAVLDLVLGLVSDAAHPETERPQRGQCRVVPWLPSSSAWHIWTADSTSRFTSPDCAPGAISSCAATSTWRARSATSTPRSASRSRSAPAPRSARCSPRR